MSIIRGIKDKALYEYARGQKCWQCGENLLLEPERNFEYDKVGDTFLCKPCYAKMADRIKATKVEGTTK